MKKTTIIITALFAAFFLGSFVSGNTIVYKDKSEKDEQIMREKEEEKMKMFHVKQN